MAVPAVRRWPVIVLGCDVSTRAIDLVALQLDSDEAGWIHVSLGKGDLLERVRRIRDRFESANAPETTCRFCGAIWHQSCVFGAACPHGILRASNILAVGVERPAGKHGVWQVSMAVGGLLQCFPPDMLVTWWMPAEWRKACGMPGNASKDQVINWTRGPQTGGLYGFAYNWPSDACDAYCVAWATRQALRTNGG